MVEVPQTWVVQKFVAGIPLGSEFSTLDAVREVGNVIDNPTATLDRMKCVSRTHVGNRGGSKNRDTNKYRRIVPFINVACLECTFAKRGSGGCIIKNPEMAVQFNMQPKEKT